MNNLRVLLILLFPFDDFCFNYYQTDEVQIISLVSSSKWSWVIVTVSANVKQWLP